MSDLSYNHDAAGYGLGVRITEEQMSDMMTSKLKYARDICENLKAKCFSIVQKNLIACVLMHKQFSSLNPLRSQMTWDDVIDANALPINWSHFNGKRNEKASETVPCICPGGKSFSSPSLSRDSCEIKLLGLRV